MKIEIKHTFTGNILFTHEQENNTVISTVEEAVSVGINLSYANLRGAAIEGANLRGANLRGASLSYANLRCASLRGANLRGADLRGANLSGADLEGANLEGATGNNSRMSCLQHGKYKLILLDNNILWGGCTKKTVKEWLEYTGEELDDYDRNYLLNVTKPFILLATNTIGE